MFQGVMCYAHRVAWQLENGLIPQGLKIRHRCDNPPSHLEIGTQADNVRDMHDRGRARKAVGEANARSKLNPRKVRKIRQLRNEGWTLRGLGKEFEVDLSGKTWGQWNEQTRT